MKIIQITDCHLFADTSKFGYKQINPYISLKGVLDEVSSYQPDLLVVTGDVSGDGSEQSYRHFKDLIAASGMLTVSSGRTKIPWIVMAGNHDHPDVLKKQLSADNLGLFRRVSFSEINWQCHFLNSHHQGTLGHIAQDELDTLSSRLVEADQSHHMIFVHHHPVETNSWMDKHELLNRQQFVELLECYPQVKAVVFGHVHQAMDIRQNGIRYLACPSTCWQWASTESFALSNLQPGFRVINLAKDGQIDTNVQRIS